MLEIFKTLDSDNPVNKIDKFEKGCWVSLTAPTEQELSQVQSGLNIIPNFLRDPLDEEEKPRIDIDENQVLIIVDTPYVYGDGQSLKFETIPVGIIVTEDYFVTVSLRENDVIEQFKTKRTKDFFTNKKTRFLFQMLFVIAKDFLKYLRHIDKKTDDAEKALQKSMRNKELFKMRELEKSLVFFTTSLKSNEIVMEKLLRGKYVKMYEEDQDLLEDVIIENKQAIEMANIYTTILTGSMDAFASIISNNLNVVMKFLTSVTIIMAIPTMISSFFGMNVRIPLEDHPLAFLYIAIFALVVSLCAIFLLNKRQMF